MDNSLKKTLLLGGLLLCCALTSLGVSIWRNNKEATLIPAETKLQTKQQELAEYKNKGASYKIYISGAVLKPGIYCVPKGCRADEAIAIAGGLTSLADLDKVNLAQRLKDGAHIKVPLKKSVAFKNNTEKQRVGVEQGQNNAIININTASARELQRLPGIGPAMAQKIISYRKMKGFTDIDELGNVPGVGKAKLNRIKARICV